MKTTDNHQPILNGMLTKLQIYANDTINADSAICTYCGELADTIDHVIPQCLTAFPLKYTVPACRECNCYILGGRTLTTVEQRGRFVAEYLTLVLARTEPPPIWAPEELEDLAEPLRIGVRAAANAYQLLKSRAHYAETMWSSRSQAPNGLEQGPMQIDVPRSSAAPVASGAETPVANPSNRAADNASIPLERVQWQVLGFWMLRVPKRIKGLEPVAVYFVDSLPVGFQYKMAKRSFGVRELK